MTQENSSPPGRSVRVIPVEEHILEIVSDSGQGAQKCGQTFSAVCARMGNGVWTVEIIPAEIKPPARSRAGASGIRIRFGTRQITNMGDEADVVVALNEQVLYGRLEQGAYRKGTILFLESKWATDPDPHIREQYAEALATLKELGIDVREMAIEAAFRKVAKNPRFGLNMFVLGMLTWLYTRDMEKTLSQVARTFRHKGEKVITTNQELVEAGYRWASEVLDFRYEVKAVPPEQDLVVMNGNEALGLGIMAAGIETVSMYPITPATSASHYLGEHFHKVGGFLHQSEDEIAAIGFAIGASYAGHTAATITSGPGLALKTEFLGLAVMAEVPLVVIVVQRGGPSTGLPTKVEQGDLLAAVMGQPGDTPKIVMAAATIEECVHLVLAARQLAEAFRIPVVLLSDANLATGVQPFPRPRFNKNWFPPPLDQSPWKEGVPPYDWDPVTGISPRPIPGQPGGEYVLTGLGHTRESHVAYDPDSNQLGMTMRSRKLAAIQKTLKPPKVHGDPEGDILVVGWGSTLGSIEEAVDRVRARGHKVSSLHLRFLSPLEPGLKEIFQRFKQVFTVEINYSDKPDDPLITPQNRRRAQLSMLLRNALLMDIDCWSNVHGQPIRPGLIEQEILRRLSLLSSSPA